MKEADKNKVRESLRELPDVRAALPLAYGDPAFVACLREAIATPELVRNFDRLYGATLASRKSAIEVMVDEATGKQAEDMRAFVRFVHDGVYLRLPSEAIHALRLGASHVQEKEAP